MFSGTPFLFSDEFGQGVNAYLCAEECCKLVVWCSFVDYVTIFLVRPAFGHCARASVVLLRMDSWRQIAEDKI